MTLDQQQIASYREQGFVLLGRVLDEPLLAALRGEEGRFRAYPQISLADRVSVLPDGGTIFRNQVASYSAIVRGVFLDGPQLDAVEQLIGPVICGHFTQFVTKLPDVSGAAGEFPWHQDSGYGDKHNPAHITVWVALDDMDERNGCVWVIPGSHKKGLLPHKSSGTSWYITLPAESDGIPVRLKAGEAVAFSGFMLHRSLANQTSRPRRAFFMEYSDSPDDSGKPVGLHPEPLWMARGELKYPVARQ